MDGTIDLSLVDKLENLNVDSNMKGVYKTNLSLDTFFSFKGGLPVASNMMIIGDPGIGKTTIMLDVLAHASKQNIKVLFISAEMGKKQVSTYVERFPHFENIETIFMSDFEDVETKDVLVQVLNKGYNLVLIDSIVEILDSIKEETNCSAKLAEKWLINLCRKHNNGLNNSKCYTTFLLIQQVTKTGNFVGSNKLKHLLDSILEIRKQEETKKTYLNFIKNRDGLVDNKSYFVLKSTEVVYNPPLQLEDLTKTTSKNQEKNNFKKLDVFLKKYS